MANMGVALQTPDDTYAVDVMEVQLFSDAQLPDKQVKEAWNYILNRMKTANLYEWKWGELVETTALRIAQGTDSRK